MTEVDPDRPLGWRHRARRHRVIGPIYKLGVLVAGLTLVGIGVAALVLPGPGWALIILGLVVLATEFAWAERMLAPVRRIADAAAKRALDPKRRRQNLLLVALAVVLVAAVLVLYVLRYGVTLEPLPFF